MIKRLHYLSLLLIITLLGVIGLSAGKAREDSNSLPLEPMAEYFMFAAPGKSPQREQILDAYVRAVGGAQASERVTTRVLKGSRVGADGVLVPEEVYAKAPNKLLTVTSYPNVVFRTGFDGAH